MVLVPFCSLLDPARAYSLVSAIETLLLEGFATPEYANSHSLKLIDQDFCRHYESLGSAKAGFCKSRFRASSSTGDYAPSDMQRPRFGRGEGYEAFDYCTQDRLHLSHSACRSIPPLILFAELLTPAVVSVNNRSCYISYFAAFCPSRGSTWPCSNGQLKLGSSGTRTLSRL